MTQHKKTAEDHLLEARSVKRIRISPSDWGYGLGIFVEAGEGSYYRLVETPTNIETIANLTEDHYQPEIVTALYNYLCNTPRQDVLAAFLRIITRHPCWKIRAAYALSSMLKDAAETRRLCQDPDKRVRAAVWNSNSAVGFVIDDHYTTTLFPFAVPRSTLEPEDPMYDSLYEAVSDSTTDLLVWRVRARPPLPGFKNFRFGWCPETGARAVCATTESGPYYLTTSHFWKEGDILDRPIDADASPRCYELFALPYKDAMQMFESMYVNYITSDESKTLEQMSMDMGVSRNVTLGLMKRYGIDVRYRLRRMVLRPRKGLDNELVGD